MSDPVITLLEQHHVHATQLLAHSVALSETHSVTELREAWAATGSLLRVLLTTERQLLVPLLPAEYSALTRRIAAGQARITALIGLIEATLSAEEMPQRPLNLLLDAWGQHIATARAELWVVVAEEADPERRPRVFRRLGAALRR